MSCKWFHALAVAWLLIGAVFISSAVAGDKDKTPLEGVWTGTAQDGKSGVLSITGNKWKLEMKGKDDFAAGTFKMDASKKPKTMDLTVTEGGGEAARYKGKTALAIYEIDGEKLKWCANEPGKEERPTDLAPGTGLYLEFKRDKK